MRVTRRVAARAVFDEHALDALAGRPLKLPGQVSGCRPRLIFIVAAWADAIWWAKFFAPIVSAMSLIRSAAWYSGKVGCFAFIGQHRKPLSGLGGACRRACSRSVRARPHPR
jgi:hypothetical protein